MNGFRQFGKELAAIVRNKKIFIPVIAVLTIPVMYSAMFLGAFWDPYGRLQDLPVAVVNEDEGATFNGESIQIGKEFEEKLKENTTFHWAFVDKEEAITGLKNNDYYMAIEIPADFSKKTTSLTSDKPEPAQLTYLPNESYNFLAAQIGNTAVEQMKSTLNKEVTETYARTVFEQLQDVASGIGKASDGASEIAGGAAEAKDGALLLEQNMNKLTSGALSLQSGADQLSAAGQQLQTGSNQLNAGASSLAGGMKELTAAGNRIAGGAADAREASSQLAQGLAASASGTAELESAAAQLAQGLEKLAQSDKQLEANESFQALLAASKQIEAGLTRSSAGQQQLNAGAMKLDEGLSQLVSGIDTFGQKMSEASAGASSVAAGAQQLDEGASKLEAGLKQLSGSMGAFLNGAKQLEDGTTQLATGLLKLDDGTHELSSKLSDASRQTENMSLTDAMTDMFADPIHLEVHPVTEVPNYGTGFAPYFLSLGLYVGALLITIVYTVKEPVIQPANGWSWFWSKTLTLGLVGVIQALIADAALIFLLKLEVQSMPLFILFSILTSVAFMMLIQFFVTTLGNPGRFVAIVLLILQLTSSAGTFPLELIPGWLQHVTPWLPMTYSVAGLKAIISSGNFDAMWQIAGTLIGCGGIFGAMTLAYFSYSHRAQKMSAN